MADVFFNSDQDENGFNSKSFTGNPLTYIGNIKRSNPTMNNAPYSNAAGDPFGFGFKRTGGRSLPKNFGDIPGMGNPNVEHGNIRGRVDPRYPQGWSPQRTGPNDGDFDPNDPDGQHFDGYEDYLNHPGWLKDLFQPKKAEREREDASRGSLNSSCPHNSEMNCSELDDAYGCLSDKYDSAVEGGTGSRGQRRVRDRQMKVANDALKKVGSWMNTRDCEGGTSAIDSAQGKTADTIAQLEELQEKSQQDIENAYAEAQSLLNQQASMYSQDKTESADQSKMMMYAGGGLILLLTIGLIFKK